MAVETEVYSSRYYCVENQFSSWQDHIHKEMPYHSLLYHMRRFSMEHVCETIPLELF